MGNHEHLVTRGSRCVPWRRAARACVALAASSAGIRAQTPVPIAADQRVSASDALPYAYFGYAVALDGSRLAIGAPGDAAGAVYVFAKDGAAWVEQHKLDPTSPATDVGRSLDVDGDRILAGAPHDSSTGLYDGSAYVFHWNGTAWVQEARLVASDPGALDRFGLSLALRGDLAVIGAPFHDGLAEDGGAVFVFRRVGSAWSQEAELHAADASSFDNLGWSVDLQDEVIVAGAVNASGPGGRPGAVYLFEYAAGSWTQRAKVSPADGVDELKFGYSVALDGATLVSGAAEWTNQAFGAAYVFTGNGAAWVQEAKLRASDAVPLSYFGTSVSLHGNSLLVGATGSGASVPGGAYLFERTATSWIERGKIAHADLQPGDQLGTCVDLDADHLIAAAPYSAFGGPASGSVFSAETPAVATVYCTAKLSSAGCLPAVGFAGLPSASAPVPFQITAAQIVSQRLGLLFYGHLPAGVPFQGGYLCVAPPISRTPVHSSGGNPGHDCTGAFDFEFNAHIQSGVDPALVAGQEVFCQQWYRDPPSMPSTTGLSDALRFFISP